MAREYQKRLPTGPMLGHGDDAVHAEVTYQYVYMKRVGQRGLPRYRTDPHVGIWALKPRVVTTPLGRRVRIYYHNVEQGDGLCDIEYRPMTNNNRFPATKQYWVRRCGLRYASLLTALDMEINARIKPSGTTPYVIGGAAARSRSRLAARLAAVQIAAEPSRVQVDVFPPPLEGAKEFWSDTLFTPTPATPTIPALITFPTPEGEDRD